MKEKLNYLNMKAISDATGISYSALKNYSSGRTKNLSAENEKKLKNFLKELLGGIY